MKRQGKSILLIADNPNFDPIIVNEENPARIIGEAVKVINDLNKKTNPSVKARVIKGVY